MLPGILCGFSRATVRNVQVKFSRKKMFGLLETPSRLIAGSPKFAAFAMRADSEEVNRRCGEFLHICRTDGGDGSMELSFNERFNIAEVKINNYAKRNALSGKMMLELESIVTELENWTEGKAVILYGERGVFCAGGDLEFVQKIATPELGVQMSHFMQHTLNRFSKLPLISVTFVRGAAHGGGAELTTASDYRIFGKTADVRFVQAKLGITTGWGGASRLAKIIGNCQAFQFLCNSRAFTPSEARRLGFSEIMCNDNEGLDMTREWINDNFLRASKEVIRSYKSVMNASHEAFLAESYAAEVEAFRRTWGSPTHVQAIAEILSQLKQREQDIPKVSSGPQSVNLSSSLKPEVIDQKSTE